MKLRYFFCFFLIILSVSSRHIQRKLRKVHKDEPRKIKEDSAETNATEAVEKPPQIYQLHIRTEVQSRFATTLVTSRLANPNSASREAKFFVQLPDAAFISNFSMEIGRKVIVGDVKEKELAKKAYEEAKASGQSAGHVAKSPRETNTFQISVNVGGHEKVTFNLTYQEILHRVHGVYKHIVNVNPGQIVADLSAKVILNENAEITKVHVPKFGEKVGEKTNQDLLKLPEDEKVKITQTITSDHSRVRIAYKPTAAEQLAASKNGLSGQLVVLYDVKRNFDGGEIEVVNGYFVHFFAPNAILEGNKHVIFVLDKSGSMQGQKIQQTKEAMKVILNDLNAADHFNILTFSSGASKWQDHSLLATEDNVTAAINFVGGIAAMGSTNIDEALEMALNELLEAKYSTLGKFVIFMTDGQATAGEQNSGRILKNVAKLNVEKTITIHSVAFGNNADYALLKKISAENGGLARKVYEDSDAALQLQGFYAEISTLLLTDIQVTYLNETLEPGTLVREGTYNYYDGKELMMIGKINSEKLRRGEEGLKLRADIQASASHGRERFIVECPIPRPWPPIRPRPEVPEVPEPTPLPASSLGGFVERMWAYLSIKKLLDKAEYLVEDAGKKSQLREKALQLSLKYHFVTELTSMVVVQPDDENKTMTLEKGALPPSETSSGNMAVHSMVYGGRSRGLRGPSGSGVRYSGHHYLSQHTFKNRLQSARLPPAGAPALPPRPYLTALPKRPNKPKPTTTPTTPMPTTPPCSGPHEIVLGCRNRGCQDTCETYGKFTNPSCPDKCLPDTCGCEYGYVRHKGACILPRDCPQYQCEENEILLSGDCFPDCENECGKPIVKSDNCPRLCDAIKCVCKDGFVKNSTGSCIPPSQCPQEESSEELPATENNSEPALQIIQPKVFKCQVNETLRGPCSCERTCETAYRPIACALNCQVDDAGNEVGEAVCSCKDGFIRHDRKCILIGECPSFCGENERLVDCQLDSTCTDTCDMVLSSCARICVSGGSSCVCEQGYARVGDSGACIPLDQCPTLKVNQTSFPLGSSTTTPEPSPEELEPVCGAFQVFQSCGPAESACELTCENKDDPQECSVTKCGPGKCVCLPGFVKGPDGSCIDEELCPGERDNGDNGGGNGVRQQDSLEELERIELADEILRNLTRDGGGYEIEEEDLQMLDELEGENNEPLLVEVEKKAEKPPTPTTTPPPTPVRTLFQSAADADDDAGESDVGREVEEADNWFFLF